MNIMLRHDTQCCFHAPNNEYTNHKSGKLTVECEENQLQNSETLLPVWHLHYIHFTITLHKKQYTNRKKRNTNTRRTVPQLDITLKESKTEWSKQAKWRPTFVSVHVLQELVSYIQHTHTLLCTVYCSDDMNDKILNGGKEINCWMVVGVGDNV